MPKITLKEIAEHFGVSVSTVSKAISDSHEISEELKRKIQEYAKAAYYKPNKAAINFRNKNTKNIGVVIPNIRNYFFVQVLSGIERIADERGYNIISCISNQSFAKESKILEILGTGTVDGLIISTVAAKGELKGIAEKMKAMIVNQIPVAMFDRVVDLIDCDKVIVDDFEAAYKATKYFLDSGCSSIALVTPINHTEIGRLRIEGYKQALKENKIPFDKNLIVIAGKKDDLELQLKLLLGNKKVDGIMALDELTAVKVLIMVKTAGYKVPEDISIIGFTNGQLSNFVSPRLTMVSQHGTHIGEKVASLLINRIENKEPKLPYQTQIVKTSLVVRESTRKLGANNL